MPSMRSKLPKFPHRNVLNSELMAHTSCVINKPMRTNEDDVFNLADRGDVDPAIDDYMKYKFRMNFKWLFNQLGDESTSPSVGATLATS